MIEYKRLSLFEDELLNEINKMARKWKIILMVPKTHK